jgi:hypothetical protein
MLQRFHELLTVRTQLLQQAPALEEGTKNSTCLALIRRAHNGSGVHIVMTAARANAALLELRKCPAKALMNNNKTWPKQSVASLSLPLLRSRAAVVAVMAGSMEAVVDVAVDVEVVRASLPLAPQAAPSRWPAAAAHRGRSVLTLPTS